MYCCSKCILLESKVFYFGLITLYGRPGRARIELFKSVLFCFVVEITDGINNAAEKQI